MNYNFPEVLILALLSFALGVIVGQFFAFRRIHKGNAERLKMEIDRHPLVGPLSGQIFRLVLVVLFVCATGFLVNFTYTQRQCNSEFKRVIAERAAIGSDDNRLRTDNDNAGLDALQGLLTIDPSLSVDARAERTRKLLQDYANRIQSNNQKQAENEARRAANPYPDPRC